MRQRYLLLSFAAVLVALVASGASSQKSPRVNSDSREFTSDFSLEDLTFKTRGSAPYFILEEDYYLRFEGVENGKVVELLIEVLEDVVEVDGRNCRVVREIEKEDGELVEASWSYVAQCKENGSFFTFGEDVITYDDDMINSDGTWHAGVNGARAGLLMPSLALVGARYYQSQAPDVAMDRAEHVTVQGVVTTPAGVFENCLVIEETSPLEPGQSSVKVYAPGIGLIQDGPLLLVSHGSIDEDEKDDYHETGEEGGDEENDGDDDDDG